jgi:hypothetical protein
MRAIEFSPRRAAAVLAAAAAGLAINVPSAGAVSEGGVALDFDTGGHASSCSVSASPPAGTSTSMSARAVAQCHNTAGSSSGTLTVCLESLGVSGVGLGSNRVCGPAVGPRTFTSTGTVSWDYTLVGGCPIGSLVRTDATLVYWSGPFYGVARSDSVLVPCA